MKHFDLFVQTINGDNELFHAFTDYKGEEIEMSWKNYNFIRRKNSKSMDDDIKSDLYYKKTSFR
jgi:hypothetical protein